ncbi:diguanylate cyclase domain-containing protein [Cyanobacterium sp. DS4]|uniref:diguanylate cyclase domain-containing protein n=1 Tax=Cyanobacterium sp. DS4 TaxID=2878255 RepID=UPI002E81691F|nr:diguanylate cyclase [Cyanobacterium sp. Dongsha4]WVK99875.1 diguanylate cyclase [Cyanobacterium sp. Dongsha4]
MKTLLSKKLPLRLVLIIPFIVQIVGTVTLVGYLSYRTGRSAVENLANQLMAQTSNLVRDHLNHYLPIKQETIAVNYKAFQEGRVDVTNLDEVRSHLWQQATLASPPFVTGFANNKGENIIYMSLPEEDNIIVREITLPDIFSNKFYRLDNQGQKKQLLSAKTVPLDIRTTDWYLKAREKKKQTWSPIFIDQTVPTLVINSLYPIYDESNNLLGVFHSGVRLRSIGSFLSQLKFSPSGQTFIMELNGNLVATSAQDALYQNQGDYLTPLNAKNSDNPIISAIASQLEEKYSDLGSISERINLRVDVKNNILFAQVEPYKDKYGLHWLLVTIIPRSDFMKEIDENRKITWLLCVGAFILSIVVGIVIAHYISQPIERLNRASDDIASGKMTSTAIVTQITELQNLANSFNFMANQLENAFETLENKVRERTEELIIANEKLELIANLDGLTQIANRRRFDEYLNLEWQRHLREKQPLTLILTDIDYFKRYNDYFGHQQGDECLKKVAQTIASIPNRSSDLTARYGGEEFAVILVNTDIQGGITIAEQMRDAIASLKINHPRSEIADHVTLSLGVFTLIPKHDNTIEDFINTTDQALYLAKNKGRNCIHFIQSDSNQEKKDKLSDYLLTSEIDDHEDLFDRDKDTGSEINL